jgi:phospho-N-acetylmuramoyl-pentapeptide-transferase
VIVDLLYPLSKQFGWASVLNVLRYVPFRVIMATITAMLLAFVLAPWFIRELQKKQIGQVVRKDGPESHFKKAGTPTMGGALILLCVLFPTILWARDVLCDAGLWRHWLRRRSHEDCGAQQSRSFRTR